MFATASSMALGLITCHRPEVDVVATIDQLRRAGFTEELHVFCEPGTPALPDLPDIAVHFNESRLGCVGNWAHCLKWLLEQTPADYLFISEDDVAYCRGARAALEQGLAQFERAGFWSLYTPVRDEPLVGHQTGWVAANRGRDAWGTQAMCLPRSSAELLLDYPPLYHENQLRGATDAVVAQCFIDAKIPSYYHNPSLTDHLGRVSSIGNNWHANHVGLNFNPEFQPDSDGVGDEQHAPRGTVRRSRARTAVVTVYQENIPGEVVAAQAEVVRRFLPGGCEFEAVRVGHHAQGLDDYFRELRHDAYLILDIDCIPLAEWVIPWALEHAQSGILLGAAQRANHLPNGGHLYAGPCALAFSRDTFERIGRLSFTATERGDVAEELTYACERSRIPVQLLWPTAVALPKWTLCPDVPFGLGTTYGSAFYHAFEISKGTTVSLFLEKCRNVMRNGNGRTAARPEADQTPVASQRAVPHFHEHWYLDAELRWLQAAVQFIAPLSGAILELGCWEGRSTAVIANACQPESVTAVDTWRGNLTEGAEHETVRLARQRDVFATFQANMRLLTSGNVRPERMDVLEFLRRETGPVKFCHIDAAHDYVTVRETIERLLPRLVVGGVLFGHDYQSAHADRGDLDGGVERAVRELLPRHIAHGNTWCYVETYR